MQAPTRPRCCRPPSPSTITPTSGRTCSPRAGRCAASRRRPTSCEPGLLDWIEAALPQQNAEAVAAATLAIEVTGPGGRSITFGSGLVKATVTSDAPAFVRWVTRRADWADLDMQVAGDDKVLAVARMLKVF